MNKQDIEHFKKKLLKEKALLEEELKTVGEKNPQKAGGWEATPGNLDIDSADDNEVADKIEVFEENSGIVEQLDKQLEEVKAALVRIDNGTYGVSEKTGKSLDRDRLEANPAARESI